MLSDFARAVDVDGVRFQGAFGILNQTPLGKRWLFASAASTFVADGFGFEGATPSWSGNIISQDENELTVDTARPEDWPPLPELVRSYVLVRTEGHPTGFPVRVVGERSIEVERFPLPTGTDFHLDNVRFLEE